MYVTSQAAQYSLTGRSFESPAIQIVQIEKYIAAPNQRYLLLHAPEFNLFYHIKND